MESFILSKIGKKEKNDVNYLIEFTHDTYWALMRTGEDVCVAMFYIKETKRGWTIIDNQLTSKNVTLFLSRTEWQKTKA